MDRKGLDMKHTPTPWKINNTTGFMTAIYTEDESKWIGNLALQGLHWSEAEANAQHIVKCINLIGELEEKGITLEQLEKLASGEDWVAEYIDQKEVKEMTRALGFNFSEFGAHATLSLKSPKSTSCYVIAPWVFIKPTHVMTFNGKTDVPTPEDGK